MAHKSEEYMDFQTRHNMPFLGEIETDVSVPLTDEDKIDFGDKNAKAVEQIRKLERELSDMSNKIKGEIKSLMTDSYGYCNKIIGGVKFVKKTLPCFYSAKNHERVFADPAKRMEVVARCQAMSEDRQMKLVNK